MSQSRDLVSSNKPSSKAEHLTSLTHSYTTISDRGTLVMSRMYLHLMSRSLTSTGAARRPARRTDRRTPEASRRAAAGRCGCPGRDPAPADTSTAAARTPPHRGASTGRYRNTGETRSSGDTGICVRVNMLSQDACGFQPSDSQTDALRPTTSICHQKAIK